MSSRKSANSPSHRSRRSALFDELRIRLARPDALLPLSLFGLLTGVLAGAVIILFRLLVEGAQDALLPGEGSENYEMLPGAMRMLMPLLAAVLLALMFRWLAQGVHVLGVARIMERMAHHQGRCTPRAFLLQFCGAALAIIGGHSVGREGPHIFLGAASGSLLGQLLSLPNNVIRALVGCGVAAGIAASFNTPLAGVVFALEVVMMEYTVASFIPVILAAVSATTLSNLVFDDRAMFEMVTLGSVSLQELALAALIGFLAGVLSAGFIQAVQTVAARSAAIPIWWRMPLAGALVGGIGLLLPEVMGIGYDSVERALHGGFALQLLLLLLIAKLIATSLCIGLGVPGGMIGPALFIGAMLGAAVAELAAQWTAALPDPVGLFALLGMGAMMSGSLQAPLAALTAMLELSDSPDVILPGMLAVVVAGITSSVLFGKDSLFLTMLRASGVDYAASPVFQALRRIGVAGVMDRSFARVGATLPAERARRVLENGPRNLVIDLPDGRQTLMPAVDLARHLKALSPDDGEPAIDLTAIPADRLELAPIELQASLQEAWAVFDEQGIEALVVHRMTAPGIFHVYGILTRDAVERAYRP